MTNAELIAKIKAEIERRIKKEELYLTADNANNKERGVWIERDKELLSFLSTLELEKPINQDELKEEIDRLWESFADEMEGPHNLFDIYARLARHFAQWGAEHLKK